MPPKGRTPSNPPRRRPRVAGLNQPPRPTPRGTKPPVDAPDAQTPDSPTPDAQTSHATTPDAQTPDAQTPDAQTPDAVAPDTTGYESWGDDQASAPAVIETPDFGAPDPDSPPIAGAKSPVDADRAEHDRAEHDHAELDDSEADTAVIDRVEDDSDDLAERTAESSEPRRSRAEGTPDGAFQSRRGRARLGQRAPAPSPAPTNRPDTAETETPTKRRGTRSLQAIAFFVMVAVVFAAAALIFRGEAGRASTGSADNRALVDTAATTEVVGQVSKAIEVVLSYNYTKLDDNEKASREVITGKYADEFAKTFADVREISPGQKLTVTTTVLLAGVTSLSQERAEVIATMDLDAVRDTTPYNSPGRVRVVASRVDGRWKIAEMYLL